jgi:uncharacterized protein YutE (UPF0331/DUF86 family)
MAPIDKKTIDEKLFKLQEAIKIFDELKGESKDTFLKDAKIQGAIMFNLIIGIELIVDIGNHILTEVFQKPAKTYRDVIAYLGEANVISGAFAKENEAMADFRNKLIHDYGRVELGRVYEYSQKAPDIFRQFARYYAEFLEKG